MVEAEQDDENRKCNLMNMLAAMATQLFLLLLPLRPAAAAAALTPLFFHLEGESSKFYLLAARPPRALRAPKGLGFPHVMNDYPGLALRLKLVAAKVSAIFILISCHFFLRYAAHVMNGRGTPIGGRRLQNSPDRTDPLSMHPQTFS
ncbi:uncharacterized protein ARB_05965 [Trichophyton benhamiae CBS 112371]|uniref:Uncharacterized protein n=1 Tax=Arthroderma benhamiae (strain ATCC MYA-4681 / CBS 112371) TaxID=663331 RepID=D4ANZ8_ARTBC|nr:uncharacterized protein ARB_05965 [Trichophyton benhamiae CBS 112371]EFE35009.1 hypothetical protein ARB_05965 [Trichophyton benhamiae CBS 112371]